MWDNFYLTYVPVPALGKEDYDTDICRSRQKEDIFGKNEDNDYGIYGDDESDTDYIVIKTMKTNIILA